MLSKVIPGAKALRNHEIVIIGGGVHGLSLAYNLAKSGRTDVAVFERSYLGAGASGRNLSLIRSSWQQPAWAELVWYCRQIWSQISVELDYNVMLTQRGSYLCIRDERSVAVARDAVAMQNSLGIPTRMVTAAELAKAVPPLDTTGMLAGVHDPTAGISRHDALVWAYARAADRLGVAIHTETPVTGLSVSGNRVNRILTDRGSIAADIVINCAGSGSAEVAAMAGVRLPLRKLALEMFVTEPYRAYLDPIVSVIEDQAYIMQTSRGEFVGGAEPTGHVGAPRLATSYAALRQSAAVLARLFPALRGVNILRAWAGLIDMTPDGAGLVGQTEERPNFYLDCGWGGEGYMVSVGTGPLIAEYLNTGVLDRRLRPFHHGRFATGERLDDGLLVVDAAGETRT
ncbi:NAD(P)/FAD-dependent oxidoreductase [Pseudonocardia acaciae]|uniref:NAD(P)/FAD-dependent oxidoreductase n=1 Tax=Pseudonocardia acaciae TaxID=551276 RepID=UPI00048E16EA|nr:FAD-binding oxidoreductase [Pseudonocardia acaciae]